MSSGPVDSPLADEAKDAGELQPAPSGPGGGDAFRLGGEMPRVMRLSRKTLAIAGGAAGIAIGGALLWALRPVGPKTAQELYEVANPNRSETVTSAAADYGSVPKLGPPLPGDLGRPIVAAQAEGGTVAGTPMAVPRPQRPDPLTEERRKTEQERDVARASRLFLGSAVATRGAVSGTEVPSSSPAAAASEGTAASRRAFLEGSANRSAESLERVREPSSAFILQAGSVIPAALITAVHSDLPGQITAQVTETIYDSPTGRQLLIPQGARLIGEYHSEISAGQKRVLIAWDRLIFADGRSIALERLPAGDASGAAGLAGRTDYHFGAMLRAAFVSTLLGIGTELASNSEDRLARALRGGAQDTANETGRQIVERELGVSPTIRVSEGARLRVLVTRDMIFEPITQEVPR